MEHTDRATREEIENYLQQTFLTECSKSACQSCSNLLGAYNIATAVQRERLQEWIFVPSTSLVTSQPLLSLYRAAVLCEYGVIPYLLLIWAQPASFNFYYWWLRNYPETTGRSRLNED